MPSNLEPGGAIELMDILYPIACDDNSMPEDDPAYKWSILLQDGFAAAGHSMRTGFQYKEWLTEAGFVDVVEVKEKWPTNHWPRDPKYKKVGMWVHENVMAALQALSLAIFTRPKSEGGLGWKPEELEVLLTGVRKSLKSRSVHAYWPM